MALIRVQIIHEGKEPDVQEQDGEYRVADQERSEEGGELDQAPQEASSLADARPRPQPRPVAFIPYPVARKIKGNCASKILILGKFRSRFYLSRA